MIWFFDSGIGGTTAMRAFLYNMKDLDVIYFADQANCPYGARDPLEIRAMTEKGVRYLFDQGATIIIIACNTATAHAIRHLQQNVFPDRKVLGVTIPWAERVVADGYRKIGVLATESSVRIGAYSERVHILDASAQVEEISVPELVPLIEAGEFSGGRVREVLKRALSQFSPDIEAIVLGCTHYPLVLWSLVRLVPDLPIIDPSRESARQFLPYLERHPDLASSISYERKALFITSGNLSVFQSQMTRILSDFPSVLRRDIQWREVGPLRGGY